MDSSLYPFGILMILTSCPSSLDLESIASYLAIYLPFYLVLSPICRVSSSLLSVYRTHGHPLIPRTPLTHKNGAFSSYEPLPLCLRPPPCFSPSSLRLQTPSPPCPSPNDPACLFAFNLTQSLLQGPLTPTLNSPPALFSPSPTPPRFPQPCYEGFGTFHQVTQEAKDRQEASSSLEESSTLYSHADNSPDTIKDNVKFFFSIMGFHLEDSHYQLLLALYSITGDREQRRKKVIEN
ncbi:hypothetical protein AMTRI_Chr04g248900 [Amborella trichopoda]